MRDAAQLREVAPTASRWRPVFGITALFLLGVVGIFSLGYVIGGRMARLDMAHEPLIDPIARLDVQRKLHDELTFYDALTNKQKGRAVANAPVTGLSVAAKSAAPGAPPAAAPTKPPALAKAVQNSAVKSAASAPLPEVGVSAASRPQQGLLGLNDGPARPGEFTVQVSSYQSREEARAFCATLERKGFHPFVVRTDLGPRGIWYRVRVGRFIDEAKAQQAKLTLAHADIPSWVLRAE